MEQLLRDINQRLIDKVSALKEVDEDWQQLSAFNPNPPVQFPCALIDVIRVNWSNQGKLVQMGLVEIKVKLGGIKLTRSSSKAPSTQKDLAFSMIALQKDVFKALHGWAGSRHYSKLIRTSEQKVKRDDGIREYDMIFTTELYDDSASPVISKAPAVPEVTKHTS